LDEADISMRASLLLAILGLAVSWALDEPCAGLLAKVNVFVGTGGLAYGYGSLNPSTNPHGGMRLGPDTADSALDISWRHFSGYNSDDDQIRAFSHTHLVGAGIDNLGHFGVMPTLGMTKPLSWWSPFSKSREKASPGRYSVFLDKPRVQVDLQATSRFTARAF
jgi:putative alpha-1,2-mannosidase